MNRNSWQIGAFGDGIPRVSVLLPVYNGAPYLAEAIDSILNQTWRDFELIIINDGSKDESADIIRRYDDPRIRFFEQENQGLAATLNRAASLSQGLYLARQDQDDVSYPERFNKQVAFLDAHPSCGMVGTWALIREGDVDSDRGHEHPAENAVLKFDLIFNNPFVHSSMMIRKTAFDAVGGYSTDSDRQPPEDYELWSRIARHADVANIPEILLIYREVPSSMSRSGNNPFLNHLVTISAENIARFMEIPDDDQRAINLAALVHGAYHRLTSDVEPEKLAQQLLKATERYSSVLGVPQNVLLERAHMVCQSYLSRYRAHKYGKLYCLAATLWYKLKGIIL